MWYIGRGRTDVFRVVAGTTAPKGTLRNDPEGVIAPGRDGYSLMHAVTWHRLRLGNAPYFRSKGSVVLDDEMNDVGRTVVPLEVGPLQLGDAIAARSQANVRRGGWTNVCSDE